MPPALEERMEREEQEFIKRLEEKRGGKIVFRDIALLYADSARRRKEAVFVYRIGDRIYLEDFEREFRFLGFKVKPPKGYKYVKFEAYFQVSDVKDWYTISGSAVERFLSGKTSELKKAGFLARLFSQTMLCLLFKDGSFVCMQMVDRRSFLRELGFGSQSG